MGEVMGLFSPDQVGRVGLGSLMRMRVAGSEFNVAVALARLHVPTFYAGAVGDDLVGPIVRTILRGEGVNTRFLEALSGHPTGFMIKERYGLQPEPRVHYYRQHTAMHQWAVPEAMAEVLDDGWVHLSGITLMIDRGLRQRVETWLTGWIERHPGALSFDLNVRRRLGSMEEWKQSVSGTMSRASVVFASRGDLVDLWDTDDVSLLAESGTFKDNQIVVVTDSARGAWIYQGRDKVATVPAWTVSHVVDVVGAGDGFVAGVLAGRYRGWGWQDSLKLGSVVGAFAVSNPGDWEGYPVWDEAMAVLHNTWVDR